MNQVPYLEFGTRQVLITQQTCWSMPYTF